MFSALLCLLSTCLFSQAPSPTLNEIAQWKLKGSASEFALSPKGDSLAYVISDRKLDDKRKSFNHTLVIRPLVGEKPILEKKFECLGLANLRFVSAETIRLVTYSVEPSVEMKRYTVDLKTGKSEVSKTEELPTFPLKEESRHPKSKLKATLTNKRFEKLKTSDEIYVDFDGSRVPETCITITNDQGKKIELKPEPTSFFIDHTFFSENVLVTVECVKRVELSKRNRFLDRDLIFVGNLLKVWDVRDGKMLSDKLFQNAFVEILQETPDGRLIVLTKEYESLKAEETKIRLLEMKK